MFFGYGKISIYDKIGKVWHRNAQIGGNLLNTTKFICLDKSHAILYSREWTNLTMLTALEALTFFSKGNFSASHSVLFVVDNGTGSKGHEI